VALTGKQKAALLLTSLDVATAAELLKGVDARMVQDLAVELSYLEAAGHRNAKQTAEVAQQFCKSLQGESGFQFKSFLHEVLKNTVGEDKAKLVQQEVQGLLEKRDPFIAIRSADPQTLAAVLETEHPQAVAVVLSELPPKKGSLVLGLLGEGMRVSAISRMTAIGSVTPEAKARIAQMVRQRIETSGAAGSEGPAVQIRPEQSLRKVAVIIRNLDKEVQEGVLDAIRKKDEEAGGKVTELMVTWEDIPYVGDRSLQAGLRGIDEQQLALALHETDETLAQKIKSNISERAAAMVDEETGLMSSPKKDDVRKARERIVKALRELNDQGELTFAEE
jgi:flagellar motor switch protein FliG